MDVLTALTSLALASGTAKNFVEIAKTSDTAGSVSNNGKSSNENIYENRNFKYEEELEKPNGECRRIYVEIPIDEYTSDVCIKSTADSFEISSNQQDKITLINPRYVKRGDKICVVSEIQMPESMMPPKRLSSPWEVIWL